MKEKMKKQIDRLVIGGAGNRIHAYLGCLYQLKRHIKHTKHFIGVSAGSILCTFLAMGCSIRDIYKKERENPFYLKWGWCLWCPWQYFYHGDGLIPINELREYLRNCMESMSEGSADTTTFKSIHDTRQGVVIEIQALDYITKKHKVFNYINTPNVLLVDAMTASCAIPLLFTPFRLNGTVYADYAIWTGLPWNSLQKHFIATRDNDLTVGLTLDPYQNKKQTDHTYLSISDVLTLPIQLLHINEREKDQESSSQHKTTSSSNTPSSSIENTKTQHERNYYLIRIPIDQGIHGSILSSLSVSPEQKKMLFAQGLKEGMVAKKYIESITN